MKEIELDKEIDNGNITPDYKAGYLEAQKEILEKIKKLWKEKCKRMEIMSGDVAIYELNNILDGIKGEKKE